MSLELIGVAGSIFFVLMGVLVGYIIWGTEGVKIDEVWGNDQEEKN